MALELRVVGPGLDVVRRLEEGDGELVLGRDANCGVCLPDPQRNVSRRHLSVWLDAGELHFHVPEGKPAYPPQDSRARAMTFRRRAQARISLSPLPRRRCRESQEAWPL